MANRITDHISGAPVCIIRPIKYAFDTENLKAFLTPSDAQRLDVCRATVEDGDAFILVAEQDKRAIAWAVVHTRYRKDMGWHTSNEHEPNYQDGENAYLENIEVAAALRNRGIGSKLLQAAEEAARRRGKRLLWLHTDEKNVGAHRFYERHGWIHITTIAAPWKQGAPSRVYCRELGAMDS